MTPESSNVVQNHWGQWFWVKAVVEALIGLHAWWTDGCKWHHFVSKAQQAEVHPWLDKWHGTSWNSYSNPEKVKRTNPTKTNDYWLLYLLFYLFKACYTSNTLLSSDPTVFVGLIFSFPSWRWTFDVGPLEDSPTTLLQGADPHHQKGWSAITKIVQNTKFLRGRKTENATRNPLLPTSKFSLARLMECSTQVRWYSSTKKMVRKTTTGPGNGSWPPWLPGPWPAFASRFYLFLWASDILFGLEDVVILISYQR